MKHKYSELDIYEDFIHGNLEPSKLNGDNLVSLSKYLEEELEECQDMTLWKFKKTGRKFELIERIKISSAHPLAKDYFYSEELQFPNMVEDIVPDLIIEQLDVNEITKSTPILFKKIDNYTIVGVSFPSEWSELEKDRLKYCYFSYQLRVIIRQTKSNLRSDVFKSKKEDCIILIRDVQALLISYLNDIIIQYNLEENDLKINIKKSYTNKDCAALVYQSIVELLNFLYYHFSEFIDCKQVVPFNSKVINQNKFVNTSKRILKNLKNIELDDTINQSLTEQLKKVLNLNVNSRITYNEISYFKKFLSSFDRYLVNNNSSTLSQEQIIRFLIGFNFNDYVLFEHLIFTYRTELSDSDTYQEMEFYLIRKRTELKQIFCLSQEPLIPSQASCLTILNEWAESELEYVRKMKESVPDSIKYTSKEKAQLTSNMNLSELALLFMILHQNKHIECNSTNDLARWINKSFVNKEGKEFSFHNIRNNVYSNLPKAKEKIKKISIEVINELNSI